MDWILFILYQLNLTIWPDKRGGLITEGLLYNPNKLNLAFVFGDSIISQSESCIILEQALSKTINTICYKNMQNNSLWGRHHGWRGRGLLSHP
jgi:hypothetical protein